MKQQKVWFYTALMSVVFVLAAAGSVKAAQLVFDEQPGETSSLQEAGGQNEARELDAVDFGHMAVKKDKIFTITFSQPVKQNLYGEEIWVIHEDGRLIPSILAVDYLKPRQVHIFPDGEWEPGRHELIISTEVMSETSQRLAEEVRMYFTVESDAVEPEETVEFESYYDFTWQYTKRGYDKFLLEGKKDGVLVARYTTSNDYVPDLPIKIGDSKAELVWQYERRGEKQLVELDKGKFDSDHMKSRLTFSDGSRYATYFIDETNGSRVRAIMWIDKATEDRAKDWYKTPTNKYLFDSERLMYELVNQARHSAGKELIHRNEKLEYSAREHSREMAAAKSLFHINSKGENPSERAESWGMQPNSVAEIISRKHLNVIYAHEAMMNSPDHRSIMLGAGYYQIGIGLAFDEDRAPYITQKYYNKLTP